MAYWLGSGKESSLFLYLLCGRYRPRKPSVGNWDFRHTNAGRLPLRRQRSTSAPGWNTTRLPEVFSLQNTFYIKDIDGAKSDEAFCTTEIKNSKNDEVGIKMQALLAKERNQVVAIGISESDHAATSGASPSLTTLQSTLLDRNITQPPEIFSSGCLHHSVLALGWEDSIASSALIRLWNFRMVIMLLNYHIYSLWSQQNTLWTAMKKK